jgi:16S rRNA (guanine966-N2)-methyltransferase
MRIIAGTRRGRRIGAPSGRDTRPTSDRVREAIFDMLVARLGSDLGGGRALDTFAGSGALGLEALSRGAGSALFVESDRKALKVLRANIAELSLQPRARVVAADAFKLVAANALPAGPFSLLFADPPYRIDAARVGELFAALMRGGAVETDAWAVYEHDAGTRAVWPEPFSEVDRRVYGTTAVSIATVEPGGGL